MTITSEPSCFCATCWKAASLASYASPRDWKCWADKIILSIDSVPDWLTRMSLANSSIELHAALQEKYEKEIAMIDNPYRLLGNATLGFLYMRFEQEDLGFSEFLTKAGNEADSGASDISCEILYDILNKYECNMNNEHSANALKDSVKEIFAPYKMLAEKLWTDTSCAKNSGACFGAK